MPPMKEVLILLIRQKCIPCRQKQTTQGSTERIIGTWLNKRNKRDDLFIASKVAGPSAGLPHIGTGPKFNKENITNALNQSLQRLQTDYIDLYQLHWPERPTTLLRRFRIQTYFG